MQRHSNYVYTNGLCHVIGLTEQTYYNYDAEPDMESIQFQNWNWLFKKKVSYKKIFNPQINLPFDFLIQKYFSHDNPTWNINCLE